mmetsp:Transcript_46287/g.121425  ORF Transcript_46287/g.121425 Transcript_46287/m.121425 type:complete len:239 (+) Transcript_46287:155-871(+)
MKRPQPSGSLRLPAIDDDAVADLEGIDEGIDEGISQCTPSGSDASCSLAVGAAKMALAAFARLWRPRIGRGVTERPSSAPTGGGRLHESSTKAASSEASCAASSRRAASRGAHMRSTCCLASGRLYTARQTTPSGCEAELRAGKTSRPAAIKSRSTPPTRANRRCISLNCTTGSALRAANVAMANPEGTGGARVPGCASAQSASTLIVVADALATLDGRCHPAHLSCRSLKADASRRR